MTKLIFLLMSFSIPLFSTAAKIDYKKYLKSAVGVFIKKSSNSQGDLIWLMKLRPGEYKKTTGKKLSLKEIIGLRIMQIRVKRSLRKENLSRLDASQIGPRKKPKLLVALLIAFGITILVLGIFFLIGSQIDWN